MPLYLSSDHETRATTLDRMVAAVWAWMLGRQHDDQLRWSLGTLPRFSASETIREGEQ